MAQNKQKIRKADYDVSKRADESKSGMSRGKSIGTSTKTCFLQKVGF